MLNLNKLNIVKNGSTSIESLQIHKELFDVEVTNLVDLIKDVNDVKLKNKLLNALYDVIITNKKLMTDYLGGQLQLIEKDIKDAAINPYRNRIFINPDLLPEMRKILLRHQQLINKFLSKAPLFKED